MTVAGLSQSSATQEGQSKTSYSSTSFLTLCDVQYQRERLLTRPSLSPTLAKCVQSVPRGIDSWPTAFDDHSTRHELVPGAICKIYYPVCCFSTQKDAIMGMRRSTAGLGIAVGAFQSKYSR
jgi:hypothetical protein